MSAALYEWFKEFRENLEFSEPVTHIVYVYEKHVKGNL